MEALTRNIENRLITCKINIDFVNFAKINDILSWIYQQGQFIKLNLKITLKYHRIDENEGLFNDFIRSNQFNELQITDSL